MTPLDPPSTINENISGPRGPVQSVIVQNMSVVESAKTLDVDAKMLNISSLEMCDTGSQLQSSLCVFTTSKYNGCIFVPRQNSVTAAKGPESRVCSIKR